jgi:hypothetical protein
VLQEKAFVAEKKYDTVEPISELGRKISVGRKPPQLKLSVGKDDIQEFRSLPDFTSE